MPMFATSHYQTEIDEAISMGFSTKAIAKKLNIPHEVLLQVLKERRQQRDDWQAIINKKYE